MRFRIPDWLIYAALIGLFYNYARTRTENMPAPPPPPVELGDMLPDQSPRDERVLVEIGSPESGTGTAFAVDDSGTWVTARHVVDSCDETYLYTGGGQAVRATVANSPSSDVAVLRTAWSRPPLPSDIGTRKRVGERGYFFGYPQGRPGEVVGNLIGRARMQVRGRYRTDEPVFAWSEVGRTRGLLGSLGGLSGGPVLDEDGEVVGVVAAENPRRGRVYSVAPISLRPVFEDPREAPEPIEGASYGTTADRYRRERRIVQVVCVVDDEGWFQFRER